MNLFWLYFLLLFFSWQHFLIKTYTRQSMTAISSVSIVREVQPMTALQLWRFFDSKRLKHLKRRNSQKRKHIVLHCRQRTEPRPQTTSSSSSLSKILDSGYWVLYVQILMARVEVLPCSRNEQADLTTLLDITFCEVCKCGF